MSEPHAGKRMMTPTYRTIKEAAPQGEASSSLRTVTGSIFRV